MIRSQPGNTGSMRVMVRLGVLAFTFAIGVVDAQPAGTADWTVYLRRAGPIRIGMPFEQVRRALIDRGASLERNVPNALSEECAYVRSAGLPGRLGFMFTRGRLVRIDVLEPGIRTASGIGVGSTEGDVTRTYPGRIQTGPHKYDPNGRYLTYVAMDAEDRPFGIVFETDGQKVTTFRTGTVAAVALVEGCS